MKEQQRHSNPASENRFNLPRLKLAHKGILIVAVPLILQGAIYLELKRELTLAESQAAQLEITRQIIAKVNTLFLNTFFSFQSLVQLSFRGSPAKQKEFDRLANSIKSESEELARRLEKDAGEPEQAKTIRKAASELLICLKETQFSTEKANEAYAVFDELDKNVRFKDAALIFLRQLQIIGLSQQEKLLPQSSQEKEFRNRLQQIFDLAVALNTGLATMPFRLKRLIKARIKAREMVLVGFKAMVGMTKSRWYYKWCSILVTIS